MMRWLIPMLCAGAMLLRPEVSLQAAADACALFARSVLPGLNPNMILLLPALDPLPPKPRIPCWWPWAGGPVPPAARRSAPPGRAAWTPAPCAASPCAAAP